MSTVVAIIGAATVGEPAAADPFVSLAAKGMQDGGPPVIESEQDHADQIFNASPGQIEDPEHNSPETAMTIALGGQLDMFTSAFWASWIQSHIHLLSVVLF